MILRYTDMYLRTSVFPLHTYEKHFWLFWYHHLLINHSCSLAQSSAIEFLWIKDVQWSITLGSPCLMAFIMVSSHLLMACSLSCSIYQTFIIFCFVLKEGTLNTWKQRYSSPLLLIFKTLQYYLWCMRYYDSYKIFPLFKIDQGQRERLLLVVR